MWLHSCWNYAQPSTREITADEILKLSLLEKEKLFFFFFFKWLPVISGGHRKLAQNLTANCSWTRFFKIHVIWAAVSLSKMWTLFWGVKQSNSGGFMGSIHMINQEQPSSVYNWNTHFTGQHDLTVINSVLCRCSSRNTHQAASVSPPLAYSITRYSVLSVSITSKSLTEIKEAGMEGLQTVTSFSRRWADVVGSVLYAALRFGCTAQKRFPS